MRFSRILTNARQVFVTANSIEEVEKIKEEFSLSESQVIYCPVQNLQEELILDLTEGLGFDVIFTGDSKNLQDFWRTIAPGGRLVHIGSTNISQFDSVPFTRGATFSCIDIRTLFLHKLRLLCRYVLVVIMHFTAHILTILLTACGKRHIKLAHNW